MAPIRNAGHRPNARRPRLLQRAIPSNWLMLWLPRLSSIRCWEQPGASRAICSSAVFCAISRWNWQAPMAAAAALVLGVLLGFSSGALITPTDEVETYYADAFTGLDEDWVDWLGGDA